MCQYLSFTFLSLSDFMLFKRLQNGGALLNIDFKDCAVAVIPESVCFEMSFGEEEKKIGHGDLIPCFVVDR